ncbi:MAG: hypothetical protein SNG79_01415 [Rikenellaceae bacterium]
MSREIDELREKMRRQFASNVDSVFSAVVTEVDEELFTCTVQRDESVDYYDVRLRGLVNSELQGLAFIPKLESVVLVCRIGTSNELFVVQFTEIDKICFTNNDLTLNLDTEYIDIAKGDNITIHVEESKIELVNGDTKITHEAETLTIDGKDLNINADQTTFNGGGNGAMVKIAELESNLDSLKTYVEAINSALPTAFSAIGASTAAVGANGATSYQGAMASQVILFEDMANDKIKH